MLPRVSINSASKEAWERSVNGAFFADKAFPIIPLQRKRGRTRATVLWFGEQVVSINSASKEAWEQSRLG